MYCWYYLNNWYIYTFTFFVNTFILYLENIQTPKRIFGDHLVWPRNWTRHRMCYHCATRTGLQVLNRCNFIYTKASKFFISQIIRQSKTGNKNNWEDFVLLIYSHVQSVLPSQSACRAQLAQERVMWGLACADLCKW